MRIEENKCRRDMYQAHKYISKNLRLLRYIKGLSQEQAADMLHMSRSCYCTLENGLKMPDIITLYDISTFYDISLDYLLSFDITEHMLSQMCIRDSICTVLSNQTVFILFQFTFYHTIPPR